MSRIKVDTAVNKTATGPVDFPSGITGVAATFTGNVTVGGTITYDDVQNVDSVGVVTAGKGLRVTDEGIVVTAGVSTFSANVSFPDSVKLLFGTGNDMKLSHDGTNSYIESDTGDLVLGAGNGTAIKLQPEGGEDGLTVTHNGAVEAYYDNSKKFETTSSGITVTGTVTDDKGDVRSIPAKDQGGASEYTLIASDAGKSILRYGGGLTIPANILSEGDAVTIINASGSDITLTQGTSMTLYNTADASTGNRTLAGRGMATVWFAGGTTSYISGAGLS